MNNSMFVTPSTRFQIIDNSAFNPPTAAEITTPVYLCAFASSKGEERMQAVYGDFEKRYGNDISFEKYGQPLLQAAAASNAGAVVIAKRVVAPDSTLANTAILAKVTSKEVQKKDKDGKPLYKDKDLGKETTDVGSGNTPIMVNEANIKFECKTVSSCKTLEEAFTQVESDLKESGPEFTYPLFMISENGRGVSNKKFRIVPNYTESKLKEYMQYSLIIMENNKTIETLPFTMDPSIIEAGVNRAIDSVIRHYSVQVKGKLFESNVEKFIAKLSEITGNTEEYIKTIDMLFAKDRRGKDLPQMKVDFESEDAFNLSYVYGTSLESGDNGAFGDHPLDTTEYKDALVDFFGGKFTDDIYDLDKYKIDIVLDANYPKEVKDKIAALTTFREDMLYIRDAGTGKKTLEEILALRNEDSLCNAFIMDHFLAYDVIDPYTKKPITVTICYSLIKLLVEHFKGGRHRPLAGEKYNFIISDAIEGTVNFVPKITPEYDQKSALLDARFNYASYFEDKLIIETFCTSQDKLTQLSFANNVLAIQEVIKAIRKRCPSIRYSFMDGDDLEKYKEDVNEVINKYSSNFYKIRLTYLQDETMVANKTFYAALEVIHRDFNVAELFKVYILKKEAK